MSEFDPNNLNKSEDNNPNPDERAGYDSVSSVDSSESEYFNHLHDENPNDSQGSSERTPDSTTYHYSYQDQEANDNQHNQRDYIGGPASSYQQQTDSSQSSYYQQNDYQHSDYSGPYTSKAEEKAAKKQQRKAEKAAKKATGKNQGGGGRYIAKLIASALVFGLVAGIAFQGFNYGYNKLNPKDDTIETTSTLHVTGDTITTSTDYSEMVEQVMPSIVSITSVVEEQIDYGFWGRGGTQETEGAGSGIIIGQNDSELLVVTNYHVIEDAKKISVGFTDSKTVEASVKGSDADADLAVVSVPLKDMEESTKESIKIATLGKSSALKVGEPAIAIGNALGYGQSVTAGYISALDREVALTDKTLTLIQTDAAINPGNSGGALLNMKGEVIGINTVKYSDTTVEGMGYAIPIDTASPIIETLMNQETIPESEQAYLGITGSDVSESYSQQLNIPAGIYVQAVQEGSPAEKGGIYAGDVITKFEGNSVSSMEGLINKLASKKAGQEVTVTVKRMNQQGDYEEKDLKITLGSKKDQK